MDSKYTYDNYEVRLCKSDESLLIEFDDVTSGVLFSKVINENIAKDVSGDQSFDTETVFHMLKDFFENKPDKVTLSFTQDGKLTYSCQFFLGNIPRKLGFTIHMDQKSQDPSKQIERVVGKLTERVSALEKLGRSEEIIQRVQILEEKIKSIDMLENKLTRILEKVEKLTEECCSNLEKTLTERIERLEREMPSEEESISFEFDPNGAFAESHYNISLSNQIAVSISSDFAALFARKPLPKAKRCKFSFILKDVYYLIVGIARNNVLNNRLCCSDIGTYGYYYNGGFLEGSDYKDRKLPAFAKGDKVTFIVDLGTGEFIMFLNGEKVVSSIIPKKVMEGYDFYPFIYTNYKEGVGASFV